MESSPNLRLVPGPGGASRSAIRVLIAIVFLVLIVFPALMRFAADLFWFQEINYERVLMTELVTKLVLFVVVSLLAYLVLAINLRVARRGDSPVNVLAGQVPENLLELIERLPRLTTPAALVFSVLAGISANA